MEGQKKGFSQILKATSLFGGVQIVVIFFSILRTKVAAVLLGPAGMGIVGLFNSTLDFFGSATNFGLATSAVRSISAQNSDGNNQHLGKTIAIIQNLAWITGLVGLCIIVLLSPFLSQLVFGSDDFVWAFVFLSITLFFNQVVAGRMALIQGVRRLSLLARITVFNSIFSVIVAVPLYYLYGKDGIVSALILISLSSLLGVLFFSRQLAIPMVKVTIFESLKEGKSILKLGFFIGMSGFFSLGSAYLLRLIINRAGSLEDVGLYNAGFAMINTYVGLVFTAMATDYFPRLSENSSDRFKFSQVVNHQMEVAILLLGPILCLFIVFINPIIIILYSNAFVLINEMLIWSALGMLFKAFGWCLGYIILTKGSSTFFLKNEVFALIYQFLLNVIGYYFLDLKGLGFAFFIGYLLYSIQVMIVSYMKFGVKLDFWIGVRFLIFLILILLCLSSFYILEVGFLYYSIGIFLSGFASIYSFIELNKSVDLVSRLKNKLLRN
jgi:O-antigen/teichoic acid export membrane protein